MELNRDFFKRVFCVAWTWKAPLRSTTTIFLSEGSSCAFWSGNAIDRHQTLIFAEMRNMMMRAQARNHPEQHGTKSDLSGGKQYSVVTCCYVLGKFMYISQLRPGNRITHVQRILHQFSAKSLPVYLGTHADISEKIAKSSSRHSIVGSAPP